MPARRWATTCSPAPPERLLDRAPVKPDPQRRLQPSELGRVHRARGELDCAQQIETELGVELTHIEATLDHAQPRTGANLDAEAQAAMRARAPLPSPDRDAGRQSAGESEDVKRLINPAASGPVETGHRPSRSADCGASDRGEERDRSAGLAETGASFSGRFAWQGCSRGRICARERQPPS